jgi:predicted nuclease with TOPRIM domain
MNKILIEVSVGELLDKISILEIKKEKIKDPEKLKFISNEHSILQEQLQKNVKNDEKLEKLFKSLKDN